MTPVANLPQVSLIPVAICHWRRWHRRQICCQYRWHQWQICHRCQQHKGNWWQNLPPVSLIPLANLPLVLLIPAAICHRCHWHRWQICHRCRWHRWCTLTWEYLREFSKKFEMIQMLLSGAWGKVIHEKNLKQKISWHCPFNSLRVHSVYAESNFDCVLVKKLKLYLFSLDPSWW